MKNKLESDQESIIVFNQNGYRYYEFSQKKIEEIVVKNISDVLNEEWRTLLQMVYPKKMIGIGLFQPILIFDLYKNGKRKDPPIEAYNSIDELKENNNQMSLQKECLLFKIIDFIENNSNIKIHNSWYKAKNLILEK